MRFEIIVDINGVKWSLDAYKEEPISLTYNVADIADIASRNASFSKTIKLPETANNRQAFGDIADLAAEPVIFNPNKKSKCWILVDTLPVIEGFLQLRRVYFNKSTQSGEFEVVIYADNDNFYKQLADLNITDIDFSELDHVWNQTNVVQSWTASWNNGYYYPLIDYGQDWELGDINGWSTAYKTYVSTGEMFPATNVKYIWDKIFANAGYSYTSTFLNGDMFKDLYIPFNKSKITRNLETTTDRFTIGRTQSVSVLSGATPSFTVSQLAPGNYPLTVLGPGPGGPQPIANNLYYKMWHGRIPFNDETSPNGDPDNLYSTSAYEYVAPANFVASSFTVNFEITFPASSNGQGSDWFNLNTTVSPYPPATWIAFKRSRDPITGATVSGGVVIPVAGSTALKKFTNADIPGIQYSNGSTFTGYKTVRGQLTTDILTDTTATNKRKLYPGEKVWVEVSYSCQMSRLNAAGIITTNPGAPATGNLATGKTLITLGGSNRFWNNLTPTVSPGETIPYNSVLPANIKQKDFVSSIIKMFNLIVEPSKEADKTLVIEPRDDYYNAGKIKDWTFKLDISKSIEEQILGETQNKKTILKYKDDKDFYNADYVTTTGDIAYGEYDYYIDNDFISGEKKIEVIFSPTPIVGIYNNNVATKFAIPKIVKERQVQPQEFTDHNIRILTRFSSSTNNSWVYGDYQFRSGGPYNAYTVLTSVGFGNATHNFQVGDYIQVRQNDNGVLKPMLQANFQILEIVNSRTITIDIPFSSVGSGVAVGGTASPLKGLVGLDENLTWQFESTKFRAYPYLGHYDHPQLPSYDINFGQVEGLYYPQLVTTNNNLYEMYWSNMLNEISDKDSRIVKADFYLNAADIADFKFNDKIYIKDQYYKINKIENYDPTAERLTKVELIKTKFITIPRKATRRPWQDNIGIAYLGESTNTNIRDINLRPGSIQTPRNNVYGSGAVVVGRDNNVAANTIVVGRGNTISAEGVSVIGDNNTIDSSVIKSSVVGDRNILTQNTTTNQSKFVFGSGNTHSGVGMIYGDNNSVSTNTKNTHLFGDNNVIASPVQVGDTYVSNTTERVFIIGDGNLISNPTFSAVNDIFIQGTNSTIKSNRATVFGSGITVGETASNVVVMADNISVVDVNTITLGKDKTSVISTIADISSPTTNITSSTMSVVSTRFNVSATASFDGPRFDISSTISNITSTTTSITANRFTVAGTSSFTSGSFQVSAGTYSIISTNTNGTVIYGGIEATMAVGTFSIPASRTVVSGQGFQVSSPSVFTNRATFSSTTSVTGNFQATGVVSLSGPTTTISNLQSNTNLQQYFA